MKEELIRLEKIVKRTNNVLLLDDFNLNIFKGEILGLLSLNTVGKDSLLDLLCSNSKFDSGRIYFNDVLLDSGEFLGNYYNKVRIIENKIKLSPNLTIGDNIFVIRNGFEKHIINKQKLAQQAEMFFKNFGINIDPKKLASELTPYEACVVEIIKAYAIGTKLIILCGLSNYLNAFDLYKFNRLISKLLKKGTSFLYVDNDINILFKMANRIVIMGDGKNLRTLKKDQFHEENVMNILMGENFDINRKKPQKPSDEVVLELNNVFSDSLCGISLKLHKGEVISLLDVSGKYYEDIIKLFTETELKDGEITFLSKPYNAKSEKNAISKGIGFIFENPAKKMLFKDLSVLENLTFMMSHKADNLWLKRRIIKSVINEYHAKIGDDINASSLNGISSETECRIVYYRWLLYSPDLLICVKPFSGQDFSLRELTACLVDELAARGISILILSSNITESYTLGNRIMLVDKGTVAKEYRQDMTSIREISSDIDDLSTAGR